MEESTLRVMRRMKSFAMDKGPELVGDLFCPWAKWSLILANSLFDSTDDDAKRILSHLFGISSPSDPPRMSSLHILVSSFHAASEKTLQNAAKMAVVHSSALLVCRLTILMLLTVIGGFQWKWLIAFHLGMCAYNLGQINQQFMEEALSFQAWHAYLYILDAIATPHTFFCRFLLQLVSLGCVFFLRVNGSTSEEDNGSSMARFLLAPCVFVMCFYTPSWFGVCVLLLAISGALTVFDPHDFAFAVVLLILCTCLCVVRLLVYVSAGGFCGALFLFLCSVLVFCGIHSDKAAQLDMVTPLPLVFALLSCFYTPFWVGLCFTSTVICTLAAANKNFEAILWWFVTFAALHTLSYAFTRSFSVIAMFFLGSYFSYGCIL